MNIVNTFEDFSKDIKNGDIVHIYKKHGFHLKTLYHSLIELFTGSRIFHNVVALKLVGYDELMCVESNIQKGKQIVPLSKYKDHDLELQALPFGYDFSIMEPLVFKMVDYQPYGIMDAISIGFHEFFNLTPKKNFKNQVCSELCAELWASVGIQLKSPLVSPGKLKDQLLWLGVPIVTSLEHK